MSSNDEVVFGYMLNPGGPPSCFKGARQRRTTTWTFGDYEYPHTQQRALTEDEKNLSLDELKAKYPYVKQETKDE